MNEIRNLSLGDVIPAMRACNQAFLEGARFPEMGANVVRYIREHPEWQWGAFDGGELLGFLLTEPREEKQRVAIRLIATNPEIQGKGTGGRLLAALDKKAVAGGFNLLSVGTPFAKRFYEKYGFKVTVISLKMIREIIQQPVPRPAGVEISTLDFESAAALLAQLADDETRARFLAAFMKDYRHNRGLALHVARGGEFVGVVLGSISEFYEDFAPVSFFHAADDGLATLVRSYEYTASTLGVRYVGFAPGAEAEDEFKKLGYERAERDFYWTMYTLERPLA